ncbi:MAG: sigma-54 factor interaction domain-containing protein, partial [Actinobacteria bacterium]|nr:sigma-54 factor interaction domain-containing protein [Actinomycetota bacterium]NIU67219.1 sigma-54 factor interaction domain-containing protein [Actinomycetota bacterium]NIW29001.1 hypothetical protein [Actinomycetota bacterium]
CIGHMREALEAISELGDGPAVRRLARQVTLAAQSDVPTLVVGELGAGVPLVANAIHRLSHRHDQPCVTVPLAAWSEQEIDARLIPDHADREAPFHAAARGTL